MPQLFYYRVVGLTPDANALGKPSSISTQNFIFLVSRVFVHFSTKSD